MLHAAPPPPRIKVFDWDLADRDDLLGHAQLELTPLLGSSHLSAAVELEHAKLIRSFSSSAGAGTVHLRLEWRGDEQLHSFRAAMAARSVARCALAVP